jgi:hypothetical protein
MTDLMEINQASALRPSPYAEMIRINVWIAPNHVSVRCTLGATDIGCLLFRSSTRWSVATDVSLRRRSIQSAAFDLGWLASAARVRRALSSLSWTISPVTGIDVAVPERKSDTAQKKVTV